MEDILKRFTPEARDELKHYIKEAGGNEVFFVGELNDDQLVEAVEVYARGNEFEAPAMLQAANYGDVVIHNHPSGHLKPSSADVQVASLLGQDNIGFYIIDNEASHVYVVTEPVIEQEKVPINFHLLSEIIGKSGPVAQKLENYEYRPQQIKMLEVVSEAINENKIAIIEAGTGTGKTLAYLLPAITYAVNNKERCVVSTNTINLQEQIINKDIPFLQSVLDLKFKAVLVKGRSNYACKRKLFEAERELDLFSEEGDQNELKAIIEWSKKTADGSKSDLNFVPKKEVWEKIQSESDTSLKVNCPFYKECFFYMARRKAAAADILVANHHLLFADLAVRAAKGPSESAVLPAYERIIFDEAHNLEEVASNYFGAGITYLGLLRILNKLYRKKDGEEKGLLIYLLSKIEKAASWLPRRTYSQAKQNIEEMVVSLENLKSQLTSTMENIFLTVHTIKRRNNSELQEGEIKLRLVPEILNKPSWKEVLTQTKELVRALYHFTAKLDKFLVKIQPIENKLDEIAGSLTVDLKAQQERLDAATNTVDFVLLQFDYDHIRWLEVRQGYKGATIVRLRSSPLEVAPILQETVYKNYKNIIMTSATLTVAGRFDYMKSRLGLDLLEPERVVDLMLPAPFNYEEQAVVLIPSDIPNPNDKKYVEVISDLILRSIKITRGRTFVLFTSYGLLNLIYNRLKSHIEALGINVLKQGGENRHRLLERFKQDITSVLFATDSFWEGVDVHGEALESVIITKLPFRVPSEPVVEARVEAIERRGGNAFLEYTVPQATIKFRQGFGRLIRRKTDRGSILILDKRVIQKSYGRIFLNSLPPCRMVAGPTREVFAELRRFFSKGR